MLAPILHKVVSAKAEVEPGHFLLVVDLTDSSGQRGEVFYALSPTDPYGLAPIIRQWMSNNVGEFEIEPFGAG